MKKLIFAVLIAAFIMPSMVQAQTQEGTKFVGLGTGILGTQNLAGLSITKSKVKSGSTTVDTEKSFSFNLTPKLGYFLMDNILVGASLGFQIAKTSDPDGNNPTTITGFNVGPFARYYFELSGFMPFVEAGINFGSIKYKNDNGGNITEFKESIANIKLGVGSSFFVGEKAAFDVFAGYVRSRSQDPDATDPPKSITSGLAVELGLSLFL